MQPGLFIEVLVLQSKRLMRILINPLILFQTTPGGVFAVPQEIAVDAVAVVVVAHQFLAVEGDGGEAVDVETFVFGNEDVPFSGRVEVGIIVVQTDGGEYGLEVSAAAVVNAVRQPVVVVAEADMVAVAVELGDQLVNAAAGIDFGEQQPCAAVGGGDLVEAV